MHPAFAQSGAYKLFGFGYGVEKGGFHRDTALSLAVVRNVHEFDKFRLVVELALMIAEDEPCQWRAFFIDNEAGTRAGENELAGVGLTWWKCRCKGDVWQTCQRILGGVTHKHCGHNDCSKFWFRIGQNLPGNPILYLAQNALIAVTTVF